MKHEPTTTAEMPGGACLWISSPPYEFADIVRLNVGQRRLVLEPIVILVRIHDLKGIAGWVPELVGNIRQVYPQVPYAAWVEGGTFHSLVHAFPLLSRLEFRGVVEHPRAVRECEQHPAGLSTGDVVVSVLRAIRIPVSASLGSQLACLVNAPDKNSSSLFSRSVNRKCRNLGVPSVSRWITLGHALKVVAALQSRSYRTQLELGQAFGYADHTALSHVIRRAFGVSIRDVLAGFGVEWLIRRWVHRFARRLTEIGQCYTNQV